MVKDNHEKIIDEATLKDYFELYCESILIVANHYRLDYSSENIKVSAEWYLHKQKKRNSQELVKFIAKKAGMVSKRLPNKKIKIDHWNLPLVIEMKDGRVGVITSISNEAVTIKFSRQHGLESVINHTELDINLFQLFIFQPLQNNPDPRVDLYTRPIERHWIWRVIMRDKSPYKYILIASFIINVLGLVGITYSMQTYDRIIPAQSYPTMIVLLIGVLIAFIMDYVIKMLRYQIIDVLGKRADLRISDRVFGHSLRIRNTHRPASTGTFISQLRDLEQIREMMTASTISIIADIPYFIFFLWVLYMIGGMLAFVPLVAFFLMVAPGIISQKKLHLLANESMRESSLRSGMLVEAVQGIDDIKSMQAENRFQQQWNHYTKTSSESSLRLKHLTHKLSSWAYIVQNATFIGVVCIGTPLVIASEMSTGALVACSILSSRMMGPISQIANLITRWQQTKVSIKGIDGIMNLPVDQPERTKKIHKPYINGHFKLENLSLKYAENNPNTALCIQSLEILPGEKIAILGRNGSGKTALLSALCGNMLYTSGTFKIDDTELSMVDTADLRRDIGYLSQNAKLFYGSIRENIVMGNPGASEKDIVSILKATATCDFIDTIPGGMNYIIHEGGVGLSSGQKQSILLCRLMLKDPEILLLDEPTANLDQSSEARLVEQLNAFTATKTLIVSTHRMKVLELVQRVIVLDDGKIVLDEPKDEALRILSGAEQ